jgi:hypothetical protein
MSVPTNHQSVNSNPKPGWSKSPHSVWSDTLHGVCDVCGQSAALVWLVLCHRALAWHSNETSMSSTEIGKSVSLSERHVRRLKHDLIQAGFLVPLPVAAGATARYRVEGIGDGRSPVSYPPGPPCPTPRHSPDRNAFKEQTKNPPVVPQGTTKRLSRLLRNLEEQRRLAYANEYFPLPSGLLLQPDRTLQSMPSTHCDR